MDRYEKIKAVIIALCGIISGRLGVLAIPMILLIVCNVIDYATGIFASHYRNQEIDSYKGIKGITKKICMDKPDDESDNPAEDSSSSDNNVIYFDGGDIMTRDISKDQLKYEVNRYALTVLGREIGDADTYVELLSTGQLDWYEFTKRLQESEEGVKRWIKYTLFVDILNRVPESSEVDWWYAQYLLRYEVNKALMAERFATDYEQFKDEIMHKVL